MKRTYGRKAAKRQSRIASESSRETSEDPLRIHDGEFEPPSPTPRKRQKIVVEIVPPHSDDSEGEHGHTPSPAKRRKLENRNGDATPGKHGRNRYSSSAKKRQKDVESGTNRRSATQNDALPLTGPSMQRSSTFPSYAPESNTNTGSPSTPKRPAKDLSRLFSLSSPLSSAGNGSPMGMRSPGSIGVAKRMLGRAHTDSSIDHSGGSKSDSSSTPKKMAKDLSNLFDLSSPRRFPGNTLESPGPSRITGIAKRMLGRSHTDSSVNTNAGRQDDMISSESLLKRTRSLATPEPPRRTVPRDVPRENSDIQLSASPSPSKAPTTIHARTYAGKSRSFLVALPVAQNVSALTNAETQEDEDIEMRESYTDLRSRWGVDNSEDDPPDASSSHQTTRIGGSQALGMMNDLKSISELRSKGESRRFLDEVGYLFEGLEGSAGVGLRRASALEVVTKLCDPEFSRKAKAADFYGKTWDVLRDAMAGSSDKVLDAILLFFVALAARDPHSLAEIAQKSNGVSVLVGALDSVSPAKDVLSSGVTFALGRAGAADIRSLGLLRTEISALKALADIIINKSRLFPVDVEISSRFLVSHTLAKLPTSSLEANHISSVVGSLRKDLRLLPPRVTAYVSGLALFPSLRSQHHVDMPSLDHMECCLRLVDSFLLGKWFQPGQSHEEDGLLSVLPISDQEEFAEELVVLCVATEALMRDEQRKDRQDIARKCLCVTLRILTTLSRENASWCKAFLRDESLLPLVMFIIIRAQERWATSQALEDQSEGGVSPSEAVQAFDMLCLALGLILNWASTSQDVKDLSRTLRLDPGCTGSRHCIKTCQCPDRRSILQCLVSIYVQQSECNLADRPETSFLRGYMSVLFGLLMQDNLSNQKSILSSLPGYSLRGKIATLIDNTQQFMRLYGDLSVQLSAIPVEDIQEDDDSMETQDHGVDKSTRRGSGEDIAKGVITFFEMMRSKA